METDGMAPHHGHNHQDQLDKGLSHQVRFADDPDRSDCLTAERNLEDYSHWATCSEQCDSESHLPCVQCGAGTCFGLASNACPACCHAWQELPGIPAFARQHQGWRGIRKGTRTLLDSGTALAEWLHDHGARPHFAGRVLRAEVDMVTAGTCDYGRVSTNSEQFSPHRVLLPSRFVDVSSLDGARRSSHSRVSAGLRTMCHGLGKSCG